MDDDDRPSYGQDDRSSSGSPSGYGYSDADSTAPTGIPNAGERQNQDHDPRPRHNPWETASSFQAHNTQPAPGDLTHRHAPKDVPVSGSTRVILFLVGLAILIGGLSLALPNRSVMDPHLVRAMLVLAIFGSVAVYWSRQSLSKILKMVGLWTLIIMGISAYYLAQSNFGDRFMAAMDPSTAILSDDGMIIHKAADGHFYIRTLINGEKVRMMVDTGASNIVLSPDDAKRVGLDPDRLTFNGMAETANGQVRLARARVESLRIGDALLEDVMVTVNGAQMRGSLLGLSALSSFASFEFRGDQLILRP